MRAADLEAPFRGVRKQTAVESVPDPLPVAGREPSEAEWERVRALRLIHAFASVMPAHAFFVGPSAALLWKAPLPRNLHKELHVGAFHPRTPVRRPGIRGVQVRPHLACQTTVDGFRVSDPASTWAMLAPFIEVRELVVVADHMLRIPRIGGTDLVERPPHATLDELVAAAEAGRRVGVAKLREALPLARVGSASRPETILRLNLYEAQLPEPELNADICDRHGRFIACGDLVYRRQRVVVEYEGDGHRDRTQFDRDIERYQRLAEEGWTPVRLTSDHVFKKPAEGVRRVRDALDRRRTSGA